MGGGFDVFGQMKNAAEVWGTKLAENWPAFEKRIVRRNDLQALPLAPDGELLYPSDLRYAQRMKSLLDAVHEEHPSVVVLPLVFWSDDTVTSNTNWGGENVQDIIMSPVIRNKDGERRDLREFMERIGVVEDVYAHPLFGANDLHAKVIYAEARQRVYEYVFYFIAETQRKPMKVEVAPGQIIEVVCCPTGP